MRHWPKRGCHDLKIVERRSGNRAMAKRVHLSEEDILKDRLVYVGTLAGGLAHEVRSPLNSIHLNVELLEMAGCKLEGEDEQLFFRRIKRIKDEVANLQKTLTEFLQFAKPPGVQRLATSIKDFLYDVIEFVQPELISEGVRLKIECGQHDYPILIDRRQMGQVLMNLLFNARDAVLEAGGGHIALRTFEEESHVRMEIEDDGQGIDEETLPKIFDAFYTTKEKGTGLGLGIAKRIVYEHGGTMDVRTPVVDGRGSCFIIRLPKEKLLTHAVGDSS